MMTMMLGGTYLVFDMVDGGGVDGVWWWMAKNSDVMHQTRLVQ